jgi:hypothetical protein
MRRSRPPIAATLTMATLSTALAACGSAANERITAISAVSPARWRAAVPIRRVLDLSAPRSDGALVVATAGRLALLTPSGALEQLASGRSGYVNPGGEEPYIALSTGARVARADCTFGRQKLYVLRLEKRPGITAVDARGNPRRFARLAGVGLENGIALDATGRFDHRLLVTSSTGSRTIVYAIDCRGSVSTVTARAPRVEGGIAVAPATFGRFSGDLIATDENSGRVYAISPDGNSKLVADSGLARGGDVGVESSGFVPPGFGPGWSALVADRRTPGNPHPGDDAVLRIDASSLVATGVRPGDLLVATEGGAQTDAITCAAASCRVRHVADGPAIAHLEGHIVFARSVAATSAASGSRG